MKKLIIITALSTAAFFGCDDDSTSNTTGKLGGDCLPDNKCDWPLMCDNGKCAENPVDPGREGGPCFETGECYDNLVCFNDICMSAGNEGGPCLEDNTCNGELECISDTCVQTGVLNAPCRLDGTCDELLVCEEGVCLPDYDGDGFSSGRDCDDFNSGIVPGTIELCSSDCNWGRYVCQEDGTWSTCSASNDCACTTPGELEEVECRYCGWGYQRCGSDYQWEIPLECHDEGVCLEGTIETHSCGFCGTRTRMCGPDCTWLAWSECTGQGECQAGLQEYTTDDCTPLGYVRERECDSQCNWVDLGDCTGDCLIAPRAGGTWTDGTPDFKDEVCIPAGPFYFGDETDTNESNDPMRIIYLSQYIIDKYEVTNDRYRECVDAGVCAAPSDPTITTYFDDGTGNFPISGVTYSESLTFCQWDGGKSLPTEAQWEKSARGPYPRQNLLPWEGTSLSCDYHNSQNCLNAPQPVNSYPDGISYYGLYNCLGSMITGTLDKYIPISSYSDLPELNPIRIDESSETFAIRGWKYNVWADSSEFRVTKKYVYGVSANYKSNSSGIRCVKHTIEVK
ncbi:formylglycine-generating enzyme family protein [Myxococcota bacterium]|nr:formylglycine-generating enzyme family protein [Myxococcota bacterium]MBU1380950.1 formylglycine-generating enzyme family protein [Myxococcota bacterium]MBU1495758.1 formylglycine-generating enzyme family protein [Myxococcota bacterium]